MGLYPSNSSRRGFLAAVAATGGALLLCPDRLLATARISEVDPRVAQIVAKTIAVDMHNHAQVDFDPEIDLAGQIKRSGLSAICHPLTVFHSHDEVVADESYEDFLKGLRIEDWVLEKNHMRRALNMADLQSAHHKGEPIIIQSVEGPSFIEGRMDRIEEAYRRGLRQFQFLHERDDVVAPLGDVFTAPPHLGGLTPAGAQVIKECNRLGMLVDLAHGTPETIGGALKVATEPFLISHTVSLSEAEKQTADPNTLRRLIPKDIARAVADAGGMIGVWTLPAVTMKDYVARLKMMADVVGVDHVGIGTDSDITASTDHPYTNQIFRDENGGFFYSLAGEMLRQGFTPEEIGKVGGGNFCRVFAKACH